MHDHAYHQVLKEFRSDVFQRLTIIIAIHSLIIGFALVFVEPLPHQMVLALQVFGGFVFYLRFMARARPTLAHSLFVSSLYIMLSIGMMLLPASWLPFLVAPLLFISELLGSWLTAIGSVLFLGFALLLDHVGYRDYPVQALVIFMMFVYAVSNGSLRTIWILLHWYRAMFGKANDLLEETRARRAELVRILRSLEIAHETQQRLQTQLIYARQQAEDARRLKERFASNISHELRTPLNIILGFTEIMHLTPEVYGPVKFPPKLRQDIYQVHRNSRHLLDMIDDVLDLSHIELSQFTLNFEPTALNPFLQDTIALMSNRFQDKSVEFIVSIADELPEVQIDRTRIRQVIINLINNAQRFTSVGSVTFTVCAAEHEVIFKVMDTGIGIPPDQIHLIFDEFFQVDYSLSRATGGAGLGLAITRRFIEAHNGHLQVDSQEGVGSIFTFTLPLPRAVVTHSRDNERRDSVKHESLWLIVDADPQIGKLVGRYLQDCVLIQISDIEQLDKAVNQYTPQGIIFNNPRNIMLPIQLQNQVLPVVICSLPSTTQMVQELGVNACLSKPMLPQQIIQQLQSYENIETILVIDDDLGVVQLVQRTLENHHLGLNIRRAYDGQQACEIMRTTRPDLVMLDLVMPNMSGFEVIERMKADPQLKDIPIILLTATKHIHSDTETWGNLSIHKHIGLKPMEALKLLDAITHTIN